MRSHEAEGPKQFEVGFRGYRREPVDEYVQRLHGWLMDCEARAESATEAATVAVGERASEILRAALAVGEQARQEAEAVKAAAIENARAEADRLMEDANRQIEELQQSIDSLAVRRANVLSELGRLRQYLAAAAEGAAQAVETDEALETDEAVETDEAFETDQAPETDEDADPHANDEMDEPAMSAMSAAPDPEAVFHNGHRPISNPSA